MRIVAEPARTATITGAADDDALSSARGASALPEEDDALAYEGALLLSSFDDHQPPRRAEHLSFVREENPPRLAVVGPAAWILLPRGFRVERCQEIACPHLIAGIHDDGARLVFAGLDDLHQAG